MLLGVCHATSGVVFPLHRLRGEVGHDTEVKWRSARSSAVRQEMSPAGLKIESARQARAVLEKAIKEGKTKPKEISKSRPRSCRSTRR